jgi:hypothetical protein
MKVIQTRSSIILILSFSLIGSGILVPNSSAQDAQIPDWVRHVAGWWANGEISANEFLSGIEYLINNNIITIPFIPCGVMSTPLASGEYAMITNPPIPDWIKNNAMWWNEGLIEDTEFINGIEYLIKKQIMSIDNKKIVGKVPLEDIKFSASWGVDKSKMAFVTSSFFEIYGKYGSCILSEDGRLIWQILTLGLNPNKMDIYNEVAVWDDPQNTVVVYPYFTYAAYAPQGFYEYYGGDCDDCITTKFATPIPSYTSSGIGHQALTLLGYSTIDDIHLDMNPGILQQFDKVIMLHNEYVTREMFDAITSHPNVIYLYPNALYAEIEVNYVDETITLIRGHNYPEPEIINGFDWEFDNTHPYEFDSVCTGMDVYKIKNGWMTNCYPENLFLKNTEQLYKLLKLIKDL